MMKAVVHSVVGRGRGESLLIYTQHAMQCVLNVGHPHSTDFALTAARSSSHTHITHPRCWSVIFLLTETETKIILVTKAKWK